MKSRFAIHLHLAKRAGRHHDIRFEIPNSDLWASFATKKEIPLETGKKILLFRTNDHTEEQALMVGKIESGYGAGVLKLWDSGDCIIEKYSNQHIVITFFGKKIKGKYHLINLNQITRKSNKERAYIFFKAKEKNDEEIKKFIQKLDLKKLGKFNENIDKLIDYYIKRNIFNEIEQNNT